MKRALFFTILMLSGGLLQLFADSQNEITGNPSAITKPGIPGFPVGKTGGKAPDFEWMKKVVDFKWSADFEAIPNTDGGLLIKTNRANKRVLISIDDNGLIEHEMNINNYYNDEVFEARPNNGVVLFNDRKGRFVEFDSDGNIKYNHVVDDFVQQDYTGDYNHRMEKHYGFRKWVKTDDHEYILVGAEYHEDNTDQRYSCKWMVISLLDEDMYQYYTKRIGAKNLPEKTRISKVRQLQESGVIIGCRFDSDDWDVLLLKTDNMGDLEWQKKIGEGNGEHDDLIGMDILPDGNISVIGEVNDRIMVMTLNAEGEVLREDYFDYQFDDTYGGGRSLISSFDKYYNENDKCLYFLDSKSKGDDYIVTIVKCDLQGNTLWSKDLITGETDPSDFDLQFTTDGSVYMLFKSKDPRKDSDVSTNLTICKIPPPPLKEQLIRYITPILAQWEQRGTYEKVSAFQDRVNTQTRQAMIDSLSVAYLLDYGENLLMMQKSDASFSYDTESEVFKINLGKLGDIYVPVPIGEARIFDENFGNLEYSGYEFALADNESLVLKSMQLKNPANQTIYGYDVNDDVVFNQVQVSSNFKPIDLNIKPTYTPAQTVKTETKLVSLGGSDVDVNIPETGDLQPHTYALIIGNEDYLSRQQGLTSEQNVDFAENDARVFAEYCRKTLGIPAKQVKLLTNATRAEIMQGLAWISYLAGLEEGEARLIFYYSGHGLPDQKTREAYIIPVDVSGANPEFGVKLDEVYQKLTENPAQRVTVFLDACFSGGARNQGLVAMKNVKVKPKENAVSGNLVSFSSSTGEETSAVYSEKQHGYFTYFLLKKLQTSNGDTDYNALSDYIIRSVTKETGLLGKIQTPGVSVSPEVVNRWQNWKLK